MRYPSIKTLATLPGITFEQAKELRKACEVNRGLGFYRKLMGYTTERIEVPENKPDHTILYVNTGETYRTTLMLVDGQYRVGNWGDLVEQWG